jgi:predicted nucleotidyltransferase
MSKVEFYEGLTSWLRDERALKNLGLSIDLVDRIVHVIVKHTKPERIIIFGSRARGDYKKTSDIDIAIDCKEGMVFPSEILDEEIPTLLKFNVVDLRRVNEGLRKEILKEGIVVYEKGRAD